MEQINDDLAIKARQDEASASTSTSPAKPAGKGRGRKKRDRDEEAAQNSEKRAKIFENVPEVEIKEEAIDLSLVTGAVLRDYQRTGVIWLGTSGEQ